MFLCRSTSRFSSRHRSCRLTQFFFNDPATTEIYTLSLHDALPIWLRRVDGGAPDRPRALTDRDLERRRVRTAPLKIRSEEHTSELQSHSDLVCRLLLEKKKTRQARRPHEET